MSIIYILFSFCAFRSIYVDVFIEWNIMADKRSVLASSSSDNIELKSITHLPSQPQSQSTVVAAAPCSCTKISTMQLFYEMKQKFPTVPDNVVCEYVGQNCHNRSACIDGLEEYPNLANVYPQALRNQSNKKHSKRHSKTSNSNNSHSNSSFSRNKSQMGSTNDKQNQSKEDMNDVENKITTRLQIDKITNEFGATLHQRPNTLNLNNLDSCTRSNIRPTRIAPPPPTMANQQRTPNQSSNESGSNTPLNQPLNLSLNVIVSPVSSRPNPNRSASSQATSLSFTLHQPNSNSNNSAPPSNQANSPSIPNANRSTTNENEAFNGPSLKYTSNAYDAEIGYQSRLEITVAGAKNLTNVTNSSNNLNRIPSNSNYLSLPVSNSSSNVDLNAVQNSALTSLPSVVASSEFLEESKFYTFSKLDWTFLKNICFVQLMPYTINCCASNDSFWNWKRIENVWNICNVNCEQFKHRFQLVVWDR